MNANSKMTSIARRIHMSFWFKQFWGIICLDILIVTLLAGTFLKWRLDQIPDSRKVVAIEMERGEGYKELMLIMEDSQGEEYLYPMHQFRLQKFAVSQFY